MSRRDPWADFWQQQYDETAGESLVADRCSSVHFVSRSKGRGRRRPAPRDVRLLRYGKRCYELCDSPRGRIDKVTDEILEGIQVPDDTTPHQFLLDQLESMERGA